MCAKNAPGTDARRGRSGRPRAPVALETAMWLLDRGLWPILISPVDDRRSSSPGKVPIGRAWGRSRPTRGALRAAFGRHPRAGVGLVLGPRGRVVDLEIDDPERATPWLRRLFPDGLPASLGWRSRRGEHRLFAWDDRLLNVAQASVVHLAEGAVELRVGGPGKQVSSVCPPSPSTDGRRGPGTATGGSRRCRTCWSRSFVGRHGPAGRGGRSCSPTRRGWCGTPPRRSSEEVERVRSAEPGHRNRTLNRAAFCLGQLVAGGLLAGRSWRPRSARRRASAGWRSARPPARSGAAWRPAWSGPAHRGDAPGARPLNLRLIRRSGHPPATGPGPGTP